MANSRAPCFFASARTFSNSGGFKYFTEPSLSDSLSIPRRLGLSRAMYFTVVNSVKLEVQQNRAVGIIYSVAINLMA